MIRKIIEKHGEGDILIIGQYLSQLKAIATNLKYPIVTGATPIQDRETIYDDFKKKRCPGLIVSRVANFSINLPDARVAIQVSGSFGSRQEEAQRLGRILRPKKGENKSYFYSLITKDSSEEQFGRNRQLFLTEQGYAYIICNDDQFPPPDSVKPLSASSSQDNSEGNIRKMAATDTDTNTDTVYAKKEAAVDSIKK